MHAAGRARAVYEPGNALDSEASRTLVSERRQFFRRAEVAIAVAARVGFGLERDFTDGAKVGSHLRAAARNGHAKSKELLELAERPKGFEYLFRHYDEIRDRRRIDPERGEMPLDWQELAAWKTMMGRPVTPWDIQMIGRIDDGYFGAKLAPAGKFFGG